MMKQIPYGITDFGRIQKENYYYVDKTMFIEKIEMQPPYLFLIRPRRFGKSLTLAMLETYYDINYVEQFNELFGHLYIGQHPTRLHNKFLIMRFNFSEVSSNVNEVEPSFKLHCCNKIKDFVYKYEHLLGKEIWEVLDEDTQKVPGAFYRQSTPMPVAKEISEFICLLMNMIISLIPFFQLTVQTIIGKQRMAKVLSAASLT